MVATETIETWFSQAMSDFRQSSSFFKNISIMPFVEAHPVSACCNGVFNALSSNTLRHITVAPFLVLAFAIKMSREIQHEGTAIFYFRFHVLR